jgi:aspartate/methionine/tyrosine aminotransferase
VFSSRTNWPAAPNRYTQAVEKAQKGKRKLLDLTLSNPTTAFEFDRQKILAALNDQRAVVYSPAPKGLLSAREGIACYYAQLPTRRVVNPEELFVLSGTSEAYAHLFRLLCNAGDEVLIASPGYPLLDILADVCDVTLTHFHLFYDHGWHLDLHDLETKITPLTRAVVLVHPNNPTGSYVKADERERLVDLCARKSLALIVDEVFLDYPVESGTQASFAATADLLTFVVSGVSKICGLPQMKAGWISVSGPGALKHEAIRRLEMISDSFLSASTPIQLALPEFLETRNGFQSQLKTRLRANLNELDRQLASTPPCSRLVVEGGWYVILRVPATRSDEDLAIELIEREGVLVESGHFFDFPNDGYLILSLMTPETTFTEGVKRILARF